MSPPIRRVPSALIGHSQSRARSAFEFGRKDSKVLFVALFARLRMSAVECEPHNETTILPQGKAFCVEFVLSSRGSRRFLERWEDALLNLFSISYGWQIRYGADERT